MTTRNQDSFSLISEKDAERHEAGLRSSRHDMNNSINFELGMDQEDFINFNVNDQEQN